MELTPLQEAIIKKAGKTVEEFLNDVQTAPSPLQPVKEDVNRLSEESMVNMMAVAEAYETSRLDTIKREEESIDSMMGLAEAYELIISLQARIEALENK